MGMKVLAFGGGFLLLAAAFAVGFMPACGNPPTPPTFPGYTLVPGPTATPLPTVTPTPQPTPAPTAALRERVIAPDYPEIYPMMAWPVADMGPCYESGYCGVFKVGGGLLAAAWLDDRRMYLGDREGRIRLLDVETGGVDLVVEGLSWPRGLTVLDGRLYVSEMGNTCELLDELLGGENPGGDCRGDYTLRRDMEFLSRVSARILSYGIDESGGLNDRRVVVDKIIAVGNDHAVNGLANDGEYVYVSIGHPQFHPDPQGFFVVNADELASYGRRADLMGVIARFRPSIHDGDGDGAEVEVYAAGFRNVYGISVGPGGVIYGADNDQFDGLMTEGHLEELNAVVEGGFYGFPQYGTNEAPLDDYVIEPVAVLHGTASSYAYANADGVYVGYLYIDDEESGLVVDRFDYGVWTPRRVFNSDGNVTGILERQGLLYVVSYSGNVHVINPAAAPVRIGPRSLFHNDDYVNEAIAKDVPAVVRPGYDVYLDEGRLIYHKRPCGAADVGPIFYTHIFPVNPGDLPEARKQYGFDNLDFHFSYMGWQSGDTCWAMRELPEYAIARIRTGQHIPGDGRVWEADYDFRR